MYILYLTTCCISRLSLCARQGWVPKKLLSSERIDYPSKVFYEGQVVRCRVKELDVDDAKMILTFVVSTHTHSHPRTHTHVDQFPDSCA